MPSNVTVSPRPILHVGVARTDPDGSIQRYEWDLDGDGSFEATGETSSAAAHALTVRPAGGAPSQPGAPGSPSGSNGADHGAGTGGAGSKAPRLRIAARVLVFKGPGDGPRG